LINMAKERPLPQECLLAMRSMAAGFTRIRCELEKIIDRGEYCEECWDKIETAQRSIFHPYVVEDVARCGCLDKEELEDILEEGIFADFIPLEDGERIKEHAREYMKRLTETFEKIGDLLERARCPR